MLSLNLKAILPQEQPYSFNCTQFKKASKGHSVDKSRAYCYLVFHFLKCRSPNTLYLYNILYFLKRAIGGPIVNNTLGNNRTNTYDTIQPA